MWQAINLTPITALEIHFNWLHLTYWPFEATQLILVNSLSYLSCESIFNTPPEKYMTMWVCGDLNYRLIAAELELDGITDWRVSPPGWPTPRVNLPHSFIRISTLTEDRRESAPSAHQPQGWVVTSCHSELSSTSSDNACMIMTWIKNEWKKSSFLTGFISRNISCWPGKIPTNKIELEAMVASTDLPHAQQW